MLACVSVVCGGGELLAVPRKREVLAITVLVPKVNCTSNLVRRWRRKLSSV